MVGERAVQRVVTGSDEANGRSHVWHVLVGLVGWLLWAVLIAYFVAVATATSFSVAIFLVILIVLFVVLTLAVAVGAGRPALIRERREERAAAAAPGGIDALGRRFELHGDADSLREEIEIVMEGDVRIFRQAGGEP